MRTDSIEVIAGMTILLAFPLSNICIIGFQLHCGLHSWKDCALLYVSGAVLLIEGILLGYFLSI